MDNNAMYTEDFFESYLRNELISPEREAFENAMNDDSALRAHFDAHKKLFHGLEYQIEQDLKNKIKASMNMVVEESSAPTEVKSATIRSFNFKPFAIAASLLLVAGAWFLTQSDPSSGDSSMSNQLFALSEMENNLGSEMGFASDDKEITDAFLTDLNSLKDGKTDSILNGMPDSEKEKISFKEATMKYLFYKHLSMEDFEVARKYLGHLSNTAIDKAELAFLSCVLVFNESDKVDKECLADYAKGDQKSFAKTAKSIIR